MNDKTVLSFSLLLIITILSGCGSQTIPDSLNWEVQDFTYTDQNGNPFGLSNLKGQVWIADFIFTNCTTVCPPMTANMAKLQEKLKEAGVPVQIVSFSVDPNRDTPEAMTAFGEKFGADFSNWHFLTGYAFEEIQEFATTSFKTAVSAPAEGSDQFSHGTSFYLVNQDGVIVKRYSGTDVPFEQIIEHARILVENE
ncbi:MAG: SCO family protein [Bacillaceae bacterium]|nr:SCO family protein [Bacillaceae bacterium]